MCVDKTYTQGLAEGSSCYMLTTTPPCTHMHTLTSLSSSHCINKLSLFRKRPPPLPLPGKAEAGSLGVGEGGTGRQGSGFDYELRGAV